ncbi:MULTISPECIES: acetyl-CoA carboxylase [unclassified Sinorhizobium]|uniref:acetyl-CoA carboxylase n=1 Tax=unclassified Sinorhizobium TaxID=2613772 RepID=UPI0024C2D174|nr:MULTISPECIES: acetyl-CoA carboxylase [unclassified Sinorhizobium]MDK1377595.1 acetyl-CoA carboxylase [Sinorhizobium sp. 6-70]MDK1483027.1 acetyl-CoA carboxylase [Sinorhizobium sp. 6-117]
MSQVDFTDPATIAELMAALEAAGVDGLQLERPDQGLRIILARGRPAVIRRPEGLAVAGASRTTVKAPIAGVFLTHDPSRPTTLHRSDDVEQGDIIGFLRIGPILVPLTAPASARIMRRVAEHGAIVGFGDPLFEIELQS